MSDDAVTAIGKAWKAEALSGGAEAEEVCELDGRPFSMYYGQLMHQQNMLADVVRTSVYHKAITENLHDFDGASVLDVGTGTGLLAFFAAQAGARKVYAVEHAAPMATLAELLVKGNRMGDVIQVVNGSIEDSDMSERVDVIVSEPIGFLLVHERMLESFIAARDKFLKPGGLMMPTTSDIFVAPFTDDTLFREQSSKAQFWNQSQFYGIDLRPLAAKAAEEYMSQAVVGYFSNDILISRDKATHSVDFRTVTMAQLQTFEIPLRFHINRTALLHGLGCWFDLNFLGSESHVVLSTAPDQTGTHWYQCRLLFAAPIAVNATQIVHGSMRFVASAKTSYTVTMTLNLDGTNITSTNKINLQDQHYHYLQTGDGHTAGTTYSEWPDYEEAASQEAALPPAPP